MHIANTKMFPKFPLTTQNIVVSFESKWLRLGSIKREREYIALLKIESYPELLNLLSVWETVQVFIKVWSMVFTLIDQISLLNTE
jgi:hypothetical protein